MRFITCILLTIPLWSLSQASKSFEIGDTLPDFSYQGAFQKAYHLTDLKGSYVLVHFWASWNVESRTLQREMTIPYLKYKDKKFKIGRKFYIISISLDDSKKYCELALKKDNLPWKSLVCDEKGWNSPIVENCRVKTIPYNFLLSPDGIIVAKNLSSQDLERLLRAY
ncbi:MAG: thioredoxin family protein [Bacteroidota bacterium]|nr:thioredoxin family protein [Bacteroidota bacterium]